MTELIQIIVFSLLAILLTMVVRENNKEMGVLIGVCLGLFFMLRIGSYLILVAEKILLYEERFQYSVSYLYILLKALCASFVCQYGADVCKDVGYTTQATQIQILGKLYILLLGVPIIETLFVTIQEFVK